MGTAIRFLIGAVLICAAKIILGITEFNESYVFANPGILDAKAHNLTEWLAFAKSHSAQLAAFILPSSGNYTKADLRFLAAFAFPPFAILALLGARKPQYGILLALAALVCLDVSNLLEFNGYNSANGGYEGDGEFACYGLHLLLGAVCAILGIGRLLWIEYDIIREFIADI